MGELGIYPTPPFFILLIIKEPTFFCGLFYDNIIGLYEK